MRFNIRGLTVSMYSPLACFFDIVATWQDVSDFKVVASSKVINFWQIESGRC
jgi:hypothetical protein